ncbi:hypothetical protein K504DRAFT_305202 [Pleomassaria siparia CBS 279.74]|uniref:Uncharacterized protein n=1 Tax=Pleomassaria siparia CBS 279.74 TaxID=1314801 RepID=A0A6G1K7L9_9PLEO|nr:hypothetical protein K504DRAFT_305202 [Pleomassaria siparia CBS 279.74]
MYRFPVPPPPPPPQNCISAHTTKPLHHLTSHAPPTKQTTRPHFHCIPLPHTLTHTHTHLPLAIDSLTKAQPLPYVRSSVCCTE